MIKTCLLYTYKKQNTLSLKDYDEVILTSIHTHFGACITK